MYCLACGSALPAGLSFCNRCGTSLKERDEGNPKLVRSLLFAIVILGLSGLGMMLGGAVTLKREAGLDQNLIGFFMVFTFFLTLIIELFLMRQVSKLLSKREKPTQQLPERFTPSELTAEHPRTLPEPAMSVTENTTRTLEYSHTQPQR